MCFDGCNSIQVAACMPRAWALGVLDVSVCVISLQVGHESPIALEGAVICCVPGTAVMCWGCR